MCMARASARSSIIMRQPRPAQAGGERVANFGPYSSAKPPKAATQAMLASSIITIEPLKAATIRSIAAQKANR